MDQLCPLDCSANLPEMAAAIAAVKLGSLVNEVAICCTIIKFDLGLIDNSGFIGDG